MGFSQIVRRLENEVSIYTDENYMTEIICEKRNFPSQEDQGEFPLLPEVEKK